QLLLHLRELQLQRLQVGGPALLGLELRAQVGFLALELLQLLGLVANEEPPSGGDHHPDQDRAEADLVFLRPGPGVVEVQVLDRHLVAAHAAVPPWAGATSGASGTPSPSRSLVAFGLASITVRVKA